MYAEILAGPIKIYRAVVGTPEPLPPSDSPPAAWTLVSDNTQYTKDGLNVAMTDERDEIEVMNKLYPIKELRKSARKKFEVKLKDMKIETLALLLGNPMIQTDPTATMKGYRRVSNEMSFLVAEHALLVVGHSPYDDEEGEYGLNYWAPRCTFKGPGKFDHQLSVPSELNCMINTLVHPTLGLGYTTANYTPQTA